MDLDFFNLTLNCCQISLKELFKKGFSTGHGYIREPNSIRTAAALTCIVIQSNQNDMFGGQSVPMFEYELAPYVVKTFSKELQKMLEAKGIYLPQLKESIKSLYNRYGEVINRDEDLYFFLGSDKEIRHAIKLAKKYTENETYQAMEALVHNLNSMQSRAGAQVPFSSINYGTGTKAEERLIIKSILEATDAGLGNGETPIFPVQVFKVKDGINTKEEDPNYDLFQLSCKVSAKRLYPNYIFLDSSYNLQYYKGTPETEVASMGCRTRVIGNINGDSVVTGRGNIAFVTINLPRLGIRARGNISTFYKELTKLMEMCYDQLIDRYNFIAKKHVYNFPFLMEQGVWHKSSELELEDTIEPVLKHGTLSIGFIGLAECLKALIGKHHGESEDAQKLGLEIISYMRKLTDEMTDKSHLNFSLFATPSEGLSGRFTKIDKKVFGIIPGVTDREYYTNSSHIPVYYPITAAKKIKLEAPYHELCNAGVICYVEGSGDFVKNTKAFENIILYMKKCNIHYGAINHPVDRCPVCGYTGIINDVCPKCGRHDGEGVSVEKLKEIGVKL